VLVGTGLGVACGAGLLHEHRIHPDRIKTAIKVLMNRFILLSLQLGMSNRPS